MDSYDKERLKQMLLGASLLEISEIADFLKLHGISFWMSVSAGDAVPTVYPGPAASSTGWTDPTPTPIAQCNPTVHFPGYNANKIPAIKAVRNFLGIGLYEAKAFVDNIVAQPRALRSLMKLHLGGLELDDNRYDALTRDLQPLGYVFNRN